MGQSFKILSSLSIILQKALLHAPITPKQNGMVESKNRTLQEPTRVMLHAKRFPYYFWAEAMNTTYHIRNRVTIRSGTKETQYELSKVRNPNVKYGAT